jgi:hypothetical protein
MSWVDMTNSEIHERNAQTSHCGMTARETEMCNMSMFGAIMSDYECFQLQASAFNYSLSHIRAAQKRFDIELSARGRLFDVFPRKIGTPSICISHVSPSCLIGGFFCYLIPILADHDR